MLTASSGEDESQAGEASARQTMEPREAQLPDAPVATPAAAMSSPRQQQEQQEQRTGMEHFASPLSNELVRRFSRWMGLMKGSITVGLIMIDW